MKRKLLWMLLSFLLVAALVLGSCAKEVPGEQEEEEEEEEEPVVEPKPGEGLVIYFQIGGVPGLPWTDPAIGGAKLAAELWGVELFMQAGTGTEEQMAHFREAIAARPDGIVLMGMAGDETMKPLVMEALDLGIALSNFHWSLAGLAEEFRDQGFATFSLDFTNAGSAHAKATIDKAGLVPGDRILFYDHWTSYPAMLLTDDLMAYAEERGMIIDRIINPPEYIDDLARCTEVVAGYLAAHPDTKAILTWHGLWGAESEAILRGAGLTDPDDIWFTAADINPETLAALESGWTDLIGDGLLAQQAFYAVQQVVMTILYKIPGFSIDIMPDHHTWESIQPILPLIEQYLR